ncbi:protein kinase [Actinocorallia sp. API 0066]|uniref:serine/threonine-protein kinase n=1 Tax=Actinocorallia sp. API 0066 TaxID=2896846 RepID=UPI001E5251D0|nr:serine/threonine-protein kinase [Actinocorallia sp. API 0066]MCD0453289.1 protein kinase [Actinocorallia sp. API 0066]
MVVEGDLLGGRYRLHGLIGSGGMGSVWRATDTRLDRTVALKSLNAELPRAKLAEYRARAAREANALARIRHPSVVFVLDVIDQHGEPWIVMEHIKGGSLADRIASEPIPERDIARIAVQVGDALDAVHRAGVLHRDVKPANILLGEDGVARLVDFGIARVAGASPLTRTGEIFGSLPYLAPERLTSRAAERPEDFWSLHVPADFWSLGVTLFEALEGHRPFEYQDEAAILHAILNERPPALGHRGQLGEVVTRLLDRRPQARPGGAELAELLTALSHGLPPTKVLSRSRAGHEEIRRREGPEAVREERNPPERPEEKRPERPEEAAGAGGARSRSSAGLADAVATGGVAAACALLGSLDTGRAADVLLAQTPARAAELLRHAPSEVGAPWLDAMADDPAAGRVLRLLSERDGAARLLNRLARERAALLVSRLSDADAARALSAAAPRKCADVLLALPQATAVAVLGWFSASRAAAALAFAPPARTAALLRGLPRPRAEAVLDELGTGIRNQVRRHLAG